MLKGLIPALGIFISTLVKSIVNHWEFEGMAVDAMRIRVSLSSIIYQKVKNYCPLFLLLLFLFLAQNLSKAFVAWKMNVNIRFRRIHFLDIINEVYAHYYNYICNCVVE